MHAVYEELERQGRIGPFTKGPDGQMVPREGYRAEYPKWVTKPDGTKTIVKNLREEIAAVGNAPQQVEDPLGPERERLASAEDTLRTQQEELAKSTAELQEGLAQVAALKETLEAQKAELDKLLAMTKGQQNPRGESRNPSAKAKE